MSIENPNNSISSIGEFALIERITQHFPIHHSTTLKAVGDDAAVIDTTDNKKLITTDLLLEGIHFDLTYVPLKHLGYKAVMVNLSDIYAMNGTPEQITVSIGVSNRFGISDIEELYSGILLACDKYEIDLIGGDTSASLTGLTISVTCIGSAPSDRIVYRDGARINDLICVTGNLGAAYMGLQLLEREKLIFKNDQSGHPDFAGKEYILERQLKPEAGKETIELFADREILPTAMMDISDGLSSELLHICKQSSCGCRVYEEKIPIDYQTAMMAEEFNMNLTTVALNGGEDYELLFTIPLSQMQKIEGIEGIQIIGHITAPEDGCHLITRDQQEISIQAQGWNSLR